MPKVSINIIKDWFKNQMKPPQEQFWAWLDSFWHKDEPIPQSAVENLETTLQKKADLVDGVVPEHQLPFSVVTSEVIALGKREITGNVLKLKVHSSGANVVRVKGKLITRSFENTWTFSEITGSGINVLRGYAVKTEDDFFMVESGEQAEITDPEIPADALEIFRLALSAAGIVQDPDAENGYKLRDEDPWRTVQILNAAPMNIVTATSPSTSFNIEVFTLVPKIAAIKTKVKKNTRDGLEITLYNNSDTPVSLMAGDYVEDLTYSSFPFADNYTLKPRSFAKFKRKENKYHELATGGGSASFPEGAAPGDVLTEGTEGPEWSNRLTNAENEIDAEVVNRALADNALQSQITAEKNRNDTQDGQITANANAISVKIDKPTILVPNTEYLVGLDLNGNPTKISAGDLSFTSAFFTWNLTYMIPHSGTTYSTLKTGNPILAGASGSLERLSKAIRFSSSGATIAFQRGGVMIVATNSGIGTIELITQRKFLVETNISTQRVFVGISNNYGTTPPWNFDFSTLINTAGVILRESSPNWQFIHNGATGAPVITDTGLSHSSTHSFTWYLTSKDGVQKMILEKQSLATGVKETTETILTKFSHEVIYFHALFCIDKNQTSAVTMLDFGAMMQTKGFYL